MDFSALVLRNDGGHDRPTAKIETLSISDLPDQGDTLVRIRFSSLNYKDGLAVTGKGKIVRADYPFVPGIDLVGEVVSSSTGSLAAGTSVIGTGWGIGENWWGGYGRYQLLDHKWLVELPPSMGPRTAMLAGTAGLTAMLSVMQIEELGPAPGDGRILVTGASGGVGSLSVFFLSRLGYEVVASTGKLDQHEYLKGLGAKEVVDRNVLSAGAARPLDSARWAGAVDSVGGTTLEAVLSQTGRHGVVASCGLAGGASLSTTVFPFILRGVTLAGIDSNTCPNPTRMVAWRRISEMLADEAAASMLRVVGLDQVTEMSEQITSGKVKGRIVVDVNEGS